ncbi:hypothetical protein BDW62DRAFT_207411 [Aspergillus aurantiobrunneus]
MLERTAGCVENAGRRFLRDSSGALRTRKTVCAKLGQYNNSSPEYRHCRLASRRTLQSRDLITSATRSSSDSRVPTLGFLYPSQTQEFAINCLLRSSRNFLPRKRKKTGTLACRTFVSDSGLHPQTHQPHSDWAKDGLMSLLSKGTLNEADRAWQLYMFAGQPPDLNSALLKQLSNSGNENDHTRAKHVFDSISEESRSAEDYLNLTRSYLAAGQLGALERICREAQKKGHGISSWALALAYFIERAKWPLAQRLYASLGPASGGELWTCMVRFLKTSSIPTYLFDLSLLLQSQTDTPEPMEPSFFEYFLDNVFSNPRIIEDISTDNLLLLLQRFHSAAILTHRHFYRCLHSLQSSNSRPAFVRSIVVYRNFRWFMDGTIPHTSILDGFLRQLLYFNITAGVEYFLHEYAYFHSTPTAEAYRCALVVFARVPDPSTVAKIFKEFVAHYGQPQTWEFLSPLLYVHAKMGNVGETLNEFDRLSKQSGLKPNTFCWNILLTAYAKAGDISGCFSHFNMMLEQQVELDSYTFGTLMALCAHRGEVDRVLQLLDIAKQWRILLTTPMLDTVVEAYCNNKDFGTAESFAETCLSVDTEGSRVRMWNILLWNYAYQMDTVSISRVRSTMDRAKIQPDDMTYATFILSLALLRQTDSARRILRTLHRSGLMRATEFHYVIILYGYLKERNRDMVHIIFREIEARFEEPGLSSRLVFLKGEVLRDLRLIEEVEGDLEAADIHFEHAEKFLTETIKGFHPLKLATTQPTPGTGKLRTVEAFPAKYFESLMAQYAKRGMVDKVEQLFHEYANIRGMSIEEAREVAPLSVLSALLFAYQKADQHEKVDECWDLSFRRAREIAKPTSENSEPQETSLDSQTSSVLPAYRFTLSRLLSLHMRSLAHRDKFAEIDQVITEVEKSGFSLTTFNWSTYVQMFASSNDPTNTLRAFSIFEEKFMPAFPGWKKLRRSFGIKHSHMSPAIDEIAKRGLRKARSVLGPRGRNYWSKLYPDIMQPTYVSVVYLAAALLRARRNSIADGNAELTALYNAAPKTITAIAEMPRLKEKFQGVLLRRRPMRYSTQMSAKEGFVWTGGILGVGGRRRVPLESIQDSREDPFADLSNEPSDPDSADPHRSEEPDWSTMSYEDQFDMEAESELSAGLGSRGTDDKLSADERLFDELSVVDHLDANPAEQHDKNQSVREMSKEERVFDELLMDEHLDVSPAEQQDNSQPVREVSKDEYIFDELSVDEHSDVSLAKQQDKSQSVREVYNCSKESHPSDDKGQLGV